MSGVRRLQLAKAQAARNAAGKKKRKKKKNNPKHK